MRASPGIAFAIALLVAPDVRAAVLEWPSPACSGTLQACINAAVPGDTVRIRTEVPVDESIIINNKSLTLEARGQAALFAPGRTIEVNAQANGNAVVLRNLWLSGGVLVRLGSTVATHSQSVSLEELHLRCSGACLRVLRSDFSLSEARFQLSHGRIEQSAPDSYALDINDASGAAGGSFSVFDTQVIARRLNTRIDTSSNGANVSLTRNQILASAGASLPGGEGLRFQARGVNVIARISRNVFAGHRTGVVISSILGPIDLRLVNNTILRSDLSAVVMLRGAGDISGRFANNLIDVADCGLNAGVGGAAASYTAGFNLYSRTTTARCNGAPVGTNDRIDTAQPADAMGRQLGTSPAVNAGNNADQPLIPIVLIPVPDLDHDGRRGRVGAAVDIGAFEGSVDTSFQHTATPANVGFNQTIIDSPPLPLIAGDRLQVTGYGRLLDAGAVLPPGAAKHFGVWWNGTRHTIFNQNQSAFDTGRRFNVLLNINAHDSFVHIASAANIQFNWTRIDRSGLDEFSSAIPIVTQRFADQGTGQAAVYNDRPIGVWYNEAIERWTIFNQLAGTTPAPMPVGAQFNVMVPTLLSLGAHAFRTEPLGVAVTNFFLDHPLLNNNPCAHAYVTPVFNPNDVYVPSTMVLNWNPGPQQGRGAWAIERGDGLQIPAGAAFHVYVDPQQSRRCVEYRDFSDGFEP
jgi:hypothetical protein